MSNLLNTLNDVYAEIAEIEGKVYQLYKDSDESTSVHLTMLQQDLDSALRVLEDLLGKE